LPGIWLSHQCKSAGMFVGGAEVHMYLCQDMLIV
jgi:hypothetical protein